MKYLDSLRPALCAELGMDLVRAYLGLGLAARGVLLLIRAEPLAPSGVSLSLGQAFFLGVWHLVGGALLAVGHRTRLVAAALAVPVGVALDLVQRHTPLSTLSQNVEFSALTLVLLAVVVLAGPGPLSWDRRQRPTDAPGRV